MKAWRAFLGAGAEMKARGKASGEFEDGSGAVCLSGALRLAVGGSPYSFGWGAEYKSKVEPLLEDVARVADQSDDWGPDFAVINWNNKTATQADVIAALDAAAVVAIQEEGLEPEDVL